VLIIVDKNEIVASSSLPKDKLKDLCDVEWLEEQYLKKGMTDRAVGELLGVCRITARKYRLLFDVRNISKRGPRKSQLSESKLKYLHDKEWLEEQYLEKRMSDQEIGKVIGVCQDTTRRYRIFSGIKSRTGGAPRKPIKNAWYDVDPYLCYLIGFIFADGYLAQRGLQVGLHKRDVSLLMEFKERYGGSIWQAKNQRDTNIVLWHLGRQRLTHYLVNNWGMTPGPKSLNMPPVPVLDEQLMPHFTRGYFDGDGCIWRTKQSVLRLNITCGDGQFLTAFRDSLPLQHRFKIYECSDGCSRLRTSGKKAKNFLNWLWADGQGFHLWRKWEDYKDKEIYQCLMS